MVTLVLDPLWCLGIFAGLTALTPVAVALVRRLGACAAVIRFVVVAGGSAGAWSETVERLACDSSPNAPR